MAKFNGGIFSRARNSIGGVTFLKSRVSEGTAQTARQKVKNKDAKTEAQLINRERLKYCVDVERRRTTKELKPNWDYAISKLPAYQSFISYLMNSMDKTKSIPYLGSFAPDVGQGLLHFPKSMALTTTQSGSLSLNWSTENGHNGAGTDNVIPLSIGNQKNENKIPPIRVSVRHPTTRQAGITDIDTTNYADFWGGCFLIVCLERQSVTTFETYSIFKTFHYYS